MSYEAEAASQVAGIYTEGLKVAAEIILKLGETVIGVTVPGIAHQIAKAWRQEDKQGKLRIENLMKRSQEKGIALQVFGTNIKTAEQLQAVEADLKKFKLSYSRVKNEFVVCEDQASILNHILQQHGLNLVEADNSVTEEKSPDINDPKLYDDEQEFTNADDFLDNVFEEKEKTSQVDQVKKDLFDDEELQINADDFLSSVFDEKEKTSQVELAKADLFDNEVEQQNVDVFLDDVFDYFQSLSTDQNEHAVAENLQNELYNGKSEDMTERLESHVVGNITVAAAINKAAEGKDVPRKGTENVDHSVPKSKKSNIIPLNNDKADNLKTTKAAEKTAVPMKKVSKSYEMTR